MAKKYKYDIAFSVAEEDLPVAVSIAAELKMRNISYYLYTEHRAANLGKSLLEITGEIYTGMAKYVLMITSSTFVNKYWAGIESQFVQSSGKKRDAYILQIRVDNTQVDGLSRHIVFEDWKDNASEIAGLIAEKLALLKPLLPQKLIKLLAGIILSLLVAVLIYWKNGDKGSSSVSLTHIMDSAFCKLDTVKKNKSAVLLSLLLLTIGKVMN